MRSRLYEIGKQQLATFQKIHVFGDLHGDYYPFSQYLKNINLETNFIIFLGDYADRGKYGIETLAAVNRLIMDFPENVIALKGNHEDYLEDGVPFFSPCDLIEEAQEKTGSWRKYYESFFIPFVEKLYLSIIIPGQMLFVHGGISSKIKGIGDLQYPSPDIEKDILWSDPCEKSNKLPDEDEYENFRGSGVLFSKTVTRKVLSACGVRYLIRSHQPRLTKDGIFFNHDKMVITINSTSVYDTLPAVMVIDPLDNCTFKIEFI